MKVIHPTVFIFLTTDSEKMSCNKKYLLIFHAVRCLVFPSCQNLAQCTSSFLSSSKVTIGATQFILHTKSLVCDFISSLVVIPYLRTT